MLGASSNPYRYSYSAVRKLLQKGHTVIPIGKHVGLIENTPIILGKPEVENVDTISIYLNPNNQKDLYDYILDLEPRRIIFNPGAENLELTKICTKAGIVVENACTLVLLAMDTY